MKNLYIGNLPDSATEAELRNAFAVYGQVDSINIIRDRDTGRARAFGFVEMEDSSGAEKAIAALNGSDLGGRTIQVNEARPKADRPRGNGDQRFGFGRPGGGGRRDDRRGPVSLASLAGNLPESSDTKF
jgi:RNA recognition motif-containing protein